MSNRMKEIVHKDKMYYVEEEYKPFDVHTSLTTDGSYGLVYVQYEDSFEYGFVYHKWNVNRNYYLCVVSLGDHLEGLYDSYLETMEDMGSAEIIESSGSQHAKVYKYYNKTWKPVEQTKKKEWKYSKSHKKNHLFRILINTSK